MRAEWLRVVPGLRVYTPVMSPHAFTCPHCDAEVPRGALACPECGSDASTGWGDEADAWAGDLPAGYGDDEDDDFDEQAFLRNEGLADDPNVMLRIAPKPRTLIVLLLLACVLAWIVWR
ncbi:MAG: hypothetical protein DHS20C15_13570 [Planctomycetota bacterium]|nr:MAG: hypothetical protein DHS20C15_13570 [Planctomycetota bacterium]